MIRLVTPIQRNHVLGQLPDQLRVAQDDVPPEHHLPPASLDLSVNLLKEVHIYLPIAFRRAQPLALAAAKVPSLITANIEARAGEMRQKLIKEFAHEGQRARMVGRQGCRVAHISAARAFVGLDDLGQLLQRRILQPITQMPERVRSEEHTSELQSL